MAKQRLSFVAVDEEMIRSSYYLLYCTYKELFYLNGWPFIFFCTGDRIKYAP